MAGDWVKMRKSLLADPRVVRISSALKADRFRTIGVLFSAWCLLDEQTIDGHLEGYTEQAFDEIIGIRGIAQAMQSVGWLEIGDNFVKAPMFSEHNGQTAKRRAQESVRKMSARKADKTQTKTGTREEKRREEKSNKRKVIKEKSVRDNPPTVEEVRAHMLSQGKVDCAEEFHAYYSTNGWVQGKSSKPIVNWKAAVTNWFVQRKRFDREPLFAKSERSDPMYRPMTEVLAKESRCG